MAEALVGLDLGAATSLLVTSSGEILRNELGGHSSASLVALGAAERFIGETAVGQRSSNLRATFTALPLLLGKTYDQARALPQVAFAPWAERLQANAEGRLVIDLGGQTPQPPECLVAAMLGKLRGLAAAKLSPVKPVFSLAVPPTFGPEALRALRDAAAIADVEVKRFPGTQDCLLTCLHAKHPVPAAASSRGVVILDMGATTTSVTAARLAPGASPETLLQRHIGLGCDDLDFQLWEHFRAWAAEQPRTAGVEIDLASKRGFRLLRGVTKLRELLSTIGTARVTVESLGEDLDVELEADRDLLLRSCASELNKVKGLLQAAKEALPDGLDVGVEMVGGGTRATCVQALIREVFGPSVTLGQKLDDASAAFGATVLARRLDGKAGEAPAESAAGDIDVPGMEAEQPSGDGDAIGASVAEDAAKLKGGQDAGGDPEIEDNLAAQAASDATGNAEAAGSSEGADNESANAGAEPIEIVKKRVGNDVRDAAQDDAQAAALAAAAAAPGLSEEEVASHRAAEVALQARDADARERQEAQNALESFVLNLRGAKHREHGELLDAATLDPFLDDLENWPYSDEAESAPTATWTSKLEEAKQRVEMDLGRAWHEALEADRAATEARLKAAADRAAAERAAQPEEEDDHDRRRLKFADRLRLAERNKTEGTEIFKSGTNYKLAAARYHKGLTHCGKFEELQLSPDQRAEAVALQLSLTLNVTQCYLKMEAWDKAETYATRAIELEDNNAKALYRRAQALHRLRRIDDAMRDLRAIPEDAEDKAILKLKQRVQAEIQRQKDKQRKMAQRMFS